MKYNIVKTLSGYVRNKQTLDSIVKWELKDIIALLAYYKKRSAIKIIN